MDFDIDAALDQLEKTLNQSDHEEKETNKFIQTCSTSTLRKSADELLLLDLDPLGNPENSEKNEQDDDDKLERIKQDLQDLYTSSIVISTPSIPTPILPDVIGQQEELSTTPLTLAVEQLEFEVRQEILQHTFEQSSSSLLSPDITNISNGHQDNEKGVVVFSTSLSSDDEQEQKENLALLTENETVEKSINNTFQNEPDLIQHETSSVQTQLILHSVDSIVNAPMGSNIDNFISSSPPTNDVVQLQSNSDVVFTSCDDNDENSIHSQTEELKVEQSALSLSSSPNSQLTTTAPTQDFDLVKNVLSKMFDKNDDEILDESPVEEKESEIVNIEERDMSPPIALSSSFTTNNDDDFRFLDEMLESINGPDTDIHQLTPAEIDRVDNLLKDIVNAQKEDKVISSSSSSSLLLLTTNHETEPCPTSSLPLEQQIPIPPKESSISEATQPIATATSAAPADEELIRVEQEWAKLTEEEKTLGSIAPEWVNDDQAPACMKCGAKFSITRRRHHCRACGKIFCSTCCWQKIKLIHDDSKEDRTCNDCIKTINHVEYLWNYMRNNQKPRSSVLRKKTGKNNLRRYNYHQCTFEVDG